jgi:hypothetical protein
MDGTLYLNKFLYFVSKILLLSLTWMIYTNHDHKEKVKTRKIKLLLYGALLYCYRYATPKT